MPEPSAAEIEALFEKYKDVLPDPARETPGFKVPRQIQVEILSIDGNALEREIMDKLTEQELRTAYENRKKEFPAHRRSCLSISSRANLSLRHRSSGPLRTSAASWP